MKTHLLLLVGLVSGTALGALAQERVKPKRAADFESVHAAVAEQWKAQHWGKCFASARELVALVGKRRGQAIREALPAAPAGFQIEPVEEETDPQAAAMLAMFSAGVGSVIEQTYQGPGKSVHVTVTADSPMLQMFQMIVQNPAMLQPNQELIKYNECSAVLETEDQQVTLRFLIQDTLVEGDFQGADDDFALAMFNQAAVTKLFAAITN